MRIGGNTFASATYRSLRGFRSGWVLLLAWCAVVVEAVAQGDLNPLWPKVSPGGFITTSSPALSPDGTRIYVGVHTNRGANGQVIAVSRDRGDSLWRARAFERPLPITATPAVSDDGRTIYVGGVDGFFHALNADTGAVRWFAETDGFIDSTAAIGADGTVYVGSADGNVYAFDGGVFSGGPIAPKWVFETGDLVLASPVIGEDGTIYVGSYDRYFYALRPDGPDDQRVKWRFQTGGAIDVSAAIAWDGTIYFASADNRFYALNPDGTKKWDFLLNSVPQASPVLGADGTIYFAATDQYFYALRPGEGPNEERVKWRRLLGRTNSRSTAAVRADGKIIFGADDGRIRVLDPDNPDNPALNREFDTAESQIEGAPIVGPDGSIYFGSDFLYRLSGNGSPLSTVSSWPAFQRGITRSGRAEAVAKGGQLANLSVRAQVAPEQTLITGFVVDALPDKRRLHLLRGVGPTLARFGVNSAMPDPRVQMFVGRTVWPGGGNDNWGEQEPGTNFSPSSIAEIAEPVGAFPLPEGSRDAAVLPLLPGGIYTVHTTSADGRGGVVLMELYDVPLPDAARLVNLSTRHHVGIGEDVLICGFVVAGTQPTRLLLRGVGPGLSQFPGVSGVLGRPVLELLAPGAQEPLRRNERWESGGRGYDLARVFESVGAFALSPGSADSAMVVTVMPGQYTLKISGADGTTGEALAEIYVVP